MLGQGFRGSAGAFRAAREAAPAEDSEMTTHMKAINKAIKTLRAAMRDPKRYGEALTKVLEMQTHALAAKALDPEMLAEIKGEAEKKQFTIDFRKKMHEFLGQMFDYEIAILEGDTAAAKALHKAMLKGKSPAHKKFQLLKDQ